MLDRSKEHATTVERIQRNTELRNATTRNRSVRSVTIMGILEDYCRNNPTNKRQIDARKPPKDMKPPAEVVGQRWLVIIRR